MEKITKEESIKIKEGSKCLITKDELEILNKGKEAKIFIDGLYFYLEVVL